MLCMCASKLSDKQNNVPKEINAILDLVSEKKGFSIVPYSSAFQTFRYGTLITYGFGRGTPIL